MALPQCLKHWHHDHDRTENHDQMPGPGPRNHDTIVRTSILLLLVVVLVVVGIPTPAALLSVAGRCEHNKFNHDTSSSTTGIDTKSNTMIGMTDSDLEITEESCLRVS